MNTPKGGDASASGQPKKLPAKPSLEHLQKQAKRRVKQNSSLKLAEAQHQLAQEYGCQNWAELTHRIEAILHGYDQFDNTRPGAALQKAARSINLELVHHIIASGEFTPHDLNQALANAVWYGDESEWSKRKAIADVLLEHGADPKGNFDPEYGPLVFGACECLNPLALQYFIDVGVDVSFAPLETKEHGPVSLMLHTLGTYNRGRNARKHQVIDILLRHGAYVPPEVTPPILAIHQGDAKQLAALLDQDSSLLSRRFPDMPYGNISLRGATLLHCAVEFGEIECLEELFKRYADINMKADVIDGIGGQTPIFHAINTKGDNNFSTLEYLINRVGQSVDMSVQATWSSYGNIQAKPMTPLEYAEHAARTENPKYRKKTEEELTLLRALDHAAQLKAAILREDACMVTHLLDEHPSLFTPGLWPIAIFQAKSLSVTRLLLDRGLNPDECSAPRKPLHLAVYQCLPDIVELLIARGADAHLRNPLGETPLDLLDAYEPRPVGDPEAKRIRDALRAAGAADNLDSIIRAGEVDRLRKMLEEDASLANADLDRWQPLFVAARSGRPEITRLLLEFGADPNRTNPQHNTGLWFAAQSPAQPAANRVEVMRLLLDAGADINTRCEDGSTALHFAAWRGPAEVAEFLLSKGARNWIEDDSGKLPLDYAKRSASPDKEAIIALFSGPRIEDPVFRTAVDAITAGDLDTLKQLLQEHPQLVAQRAEEKGQYAGSYFYEPTLLHFIAENPMRTGKLPANICEITRVILDAGAEVDAVTNGPTGSTTLCLVATSEPARKQELQLPLIELLVKNGADPRRAFLGAVIHREKAAIDLLIKLSGSQHTLLTAASTGRLEILRDLLKTTAGQTDLAEAANAATSEGHRDCLELILAAGLPVNTRVPHHPYAATLLHQAGSYGHREIAELLLAHGADATLRDTQFNGTPADWARVGGHAELSKWLSEQAAKTVD